MSRPLFSLGQVVATRAVAAHLEHQRISAFLYLDRHTHGDWGSMPAEDEKANNLAIELGARVLSSYEIAGKYVWIIIEANRRKRYAAADPGVPVQLAESAELVIQIMHDGLASIGLLYAYTADQIAEGHIKTVLCGSS